MAKNAIEALDRKNAIMAQNKVDWMIIGTLVI
jgi:hypothetical protein